MKLASHPVGDLLLPSGRLVACDPVASPATEPFSLALPKGAFPTVLSIAHLQDDQRVAFATIDFQASRPIKWAVLTVGSTKDNKTEGFGVDSGVAGLMDRSAATTLIATMQKEEATFYETMDSEMKKTQLPTWSWLNLPFGKGNLIAFSPGYGDGEYLTYAGFNRDGAISVVVIDFGVAPTTDAG